VLLAPPSPPRIPRKKRIVGTLLFLDQILRTKAPQDFGIVSTLLISQAHHHPLHSKRMIQYLRPALIPEKQLLRRKFQVKNSNAWGAIICARHWLVQALRVLVCYFFLLIPMSPQKNSLRGLQDYRSQWYYSNPKSIHRRSCLRNPGFVRWNRILPSFSGINQAFVAALSCCLRGHEVPKNPLVFWINA